MLSEGWWFFYTRTYLTVTFHFTTAAEVPLESVPDIADAMDIEPVVAVKMGYNHS